MKHYMRPHHLFCGRFYSKSFGEGRGRRYRELESSMIGAISYGNDHEVEMIQGTDELCLACPDCRDGRFCPGEAG